MRILTWAGKTVNGKYAGDCGVTIPDTEMWCKVADITMTKTDMCEHVLRQLAIRTRYTTFRLYYPLTRCICSEREEIMSERYVGRYQIPVIRFAVVDPTESDVIHYYGENLPIKLRWIGDNVTLDPNDRAMIRLTATGHDHRPGKLCCHFEWQLMIQKGHKLFYFYRRDSHCLYDNWNNLYDTEEFVCPCDTCTHKDQFERIPLELTIE